MKLNSSFPLGMLCLFFSIITLFSCSKDSDLMADYIALDPELLIGKYVRSDTYQISIINNPEDDTFEIIVNSGSGSTDNSESGGTVNDSYQISSSLDIVLDVLANDTFKNLENVSIIETSQPNIGSVVISPDNTLIYTPESAEAVTDTFTYTAQVVNEDQSVITEEGSVTITVNNIANKNGTIELNTLKAFPSAFGAGQDLSGGRGGSFYEVTNLNNSGAGSFSEALNQGSGTIIIIQVEGFVSLKSPLSGTSPDNITIWGQFAPGNGLTVSDERISFQGADNWIVRHMTFQNNEGDPERSAVGWWTPTNGDKGVYIDRVSARYGSDQTLDIYHGNNSLRGSTMAYCLMIQGDEETVSDDAHNTGSILGTGGSGTDLLGDRGQITFARNAYLDISHRFPNAASDIMDLERYNNFISNYQWRLATLSGGILLDNFHNYTERGNDNGADINATNKFDYRSTDAYADFRVYNAYNYIEHINESPAENQTVGWTLRVRGSGHPDGDDNDPLPSYHYVSSRQHYFGDPADGIWDFSEVRAKLMASDGAGHNRGINADGTPGVFRDNVDTDYATRVLTNTTRTQMLQPNQYLQLIPSGTSMYTDTDGDYMPDWFENQHAHLNPNEDDKNSKHVDWDFGNYTVENNAGYTNLEICAEFYAGGFESMLD